MDPVGSWSAYAAAASYSHGGGGGGGGGGGPAAASPFNPGGFLSPPPTYDHSVFAPLFHQKAAAAAAHHYAPLPPPPPPPRPPPLKPPESDHYVTPFEQPVWSQPSQQPFGILPHESVVANSFNFQPTAQQIPFAQFPDPKRRPPSPKPSPPSNFFQPNFTFESPTFQKFDYNAPKLYQNTLQQPCPNYSPLKDYRPQPNEFTIKERNLLPEKLPTEKPKSFDILERRDPECQSSPISFAMMDSERNFQNNKVKSPQYPQNFRYGSGLSTPDSDYQRSKSSESFSSTSSSNCPDQRPSPPGCSPVYSLYSNPSVPQQNCYKPNDASPLPPPPPLDATVPRNPVVYPSVITRSDKNYQELRYDDLYANKTWADSQRRYIGYEAQPPKAQQTEHNQALPILQDIGNCRGDPMSLVKNLQNQPESDSGKAKKPNEDFIDRVPPPAHHNGNHPNGYLDFDRWNLHPPGPKILTGQVDYSQPTRLTNVSQPQSLVVPGPLPYYQTFQLAPPGDNPPPQQQPPDKGKPKGSLPSIEEELSHLSSEEEPPKLFYAPNPKMSFVDSFWKFIQGGKEDSPIRPVKKPTWSRPYVSLPKTYAEPVIKAEFPSDPQDDPRYYPLPKSSEMRSFDDSSDDSTDDSFGVFFIKKSPKTEAKKMTSVSAKRKCGLPVVSTMKKNNLAERSTQTAKLSGNNKKGCSLITEKKFLTIASNVNMRESKDFLKKCNMNSSIRDMPLSSDDEDLPLALRMRNVNTKKENKGFSCKRGLKFQPEKNKPEVNQTVKSYVNMSNSVLHFKVGDFLVKKNDNQLQYPPLWRVKDKNILQKYQHFVKDGVCLYSSLPSVVSLTVQCREIYHPLPVRVTIPNKAAGLNIVQVCSYPFENVTQNKSAWEKYLKDTDHLQDSFEVYVQTLFSQSLDSNFLQEIYDEKDEYFLCNVREVEKVEEGLKERLVKKLCWPVEIVEAVSTFPSYRLAKVGARQTCACSNRPSTNMIHLHGNPYSKKTLLRVGLENLLLNKELMVCDDCLSLFQYLHHLNHEKLSLFIKCDEKVTQNKDPDKDTTVILNQLLADENWLTLLFKEVRVFWFQVEQCFQDKMQDASI